MVHVGTVTWYDGDQIKAIEDGHYIMLHDSEYLDYNVSYTNQYVVIQDDPSSQIPHHLFEGTMNEDALLMFNTTPINLCQIYYI